MRNILMRNGNFEFVNQIFLHGHGALIPRWPSVTAQSARMRCWLGHIGNFAFAVDIKGFQIIDFIEIDL